MEKIKINGVYRHFKGNKYKVLNIATHSETEEEMVVYQKLYGDRSIWVRPLQVFLDYKLVDGEQVKRFILID